MKKILLIISIIAFALALVCCGESRCEVNPSGQHMLAHISAKDATCQSEGVVDHWKCRDCGKLFLLTEDKFIDCEITPEQAKVAKVAHNVSLVEGKEPTCEETGITAHYACADCKKLFSDEGGQNLISSSDVKIAKTAHDLVHHARVEPTTETDGKIEHWQCKNCQKYFLDANGEEKVLESKLTLNAIYSLVDFIVEVPANRNPVVLQLTDTQIIDAGQTRQGRDGVNYEFWATDQVEERCYNYLTEIINAVKPDLIILTGDIVYGEFDDSGTALTSFVEFMDSFGIYWAPIFGNHENESAKGVDWQCEQFENADNCLFLQRTLTGNGNYSVGIAQGGKITRVFYMLDSNGCANPSAKTRANSHFKSTAGFGNDQIQWYTNSIKDLKNCVPNVKISFAYHIQQTKFTQIYSKYGVQSTSAINSCINIDTHPNKADTDFGLIGGKFTGEWDSSGTITAGMVSLGVDSIFIGHEHPLSASVVHDGVRYQFGQKSSEYDKFNHILSNKQIGAQYFLPNGAKSIIGGSVIPLNSDGEIVNPYIYYCGNVFGTNP